MRLIALSMVKDESDVIELFVRHALSLFDALLVIDNGSTDGTRQILAGLAGEGLPILVYDDGRPARAQSELMTNLFHEALRNHDVDFIAPLDADEFLGTPSRRHLEATLATLPEDNYGRAPWRTHVLRPEDIGGPANALLRMRWRRRREQPQFEKVVIPARASWAHDVVVAAGNHALTSRSGETLPSVMIDGLTIRHFPVRSVEQLRSKVLSGWLAYLIGELEDGVPNDGQGWHWRSIYDLILERGLMTEDVTRVSANYAQDRDPLQPLRAEDLIEDPIEFAVESRIQIPPADPMQAFARQADAVVRIAREAETKNLALRSELDQANERLLLETQRATELEAEVGDLRATLDKVLWSTSWRITAPLRWLGHRARPRG